MDVSSLLVFLIIGAIAGWLAGLIMKGYGFGLVGNIVVGVIGAFIAGWLLPMVGLNIGGGIVAAGTFIIGMLFLRETKDVDISR